MAQLTMKELQEQIDKIVTDLGYVMKGLDNNVEVFELGQRLTNLESEIVSLGKVVVATNELAANAAFALLDEDGPQVDLSSLLDRVIALEAEFSTPDSDAYRIPEWGQDVLVGVIEALNSVRLARAMELEQALVAKYFPEGLESSPYPAVVHTTGE
jgi:hypothetical protein